MRSHSVFRCLLFSGLRCAFPCLLRSIIHAKSCAVLRCLVKPYRTGNLFPLLGKVCRLLGKNCHGTENAVHLFAGLSLVRVSWHGVCFAYWQAGILPRFTQNNKKPMTTTTDNAKLEALASFLGCEIEELNQTKWGHYGLDSFELGSKEYAIGTDSEADAACAEYIRDSVWAFNSDFIVSECGLPYQLAEVFKPFQHDKCESANDALLGLINATCGIESFVESAISADGRGNFLSSYDGEENEEGEFFIYRVN